jgi:hypothetical protein
VQVRFLGVRDLPIESLEAFPGNARVHDDAALDESAALNGQYRSVVARELPDGRVQLLAGHGTRDAFARRGDVSIRVEVIEADDSEARRINLADNGTARQASYDEGLLAELLAAAAADGGLPGTGWDEAAYRELVQSLEPQAPGVPYTQTVNIPQYEPVGPCPPVADLRDETRADAIRGRIREVDGLPDDVRDYLLAAANRHTVFNYRKAAEFYPHAPAEVQALMEESALVIIDVGDAIRLGYARLVESLASLEETEPDGE